MVLGSFQAPPGNHLLDTDQFAPPTYGGAIAVKAGSFDYTDTSAKTLFTLPAGAVPLDWWFDITTDFNAGTNNDLDIGAGADGDYFADAIAIGTQGLFRAGAANSVAGTLGAQFTEDTDITVTYIPTGTTPTTGAANFFMVYMMAGPDYVID